jgi:hypothetical protein
MCSRLLPTTGQIYTSLAYCDHSGASCRGKNFFFFMMDDGVNATAGAERADSFSEMAVTSVTPLQRRQTQRGGRGGRN